MVNEVTGTNSTTWRHDGEATRLGVAARVGRSLAIAGTLAAGYAVTGWNGSLVPTVPSGQVLSSETTSDSASNPRISVTVAMDEAGGLAASQDAAQYAPDSPASDLPALAVTIRAADGRVVTQQATIAQPGGRQAATLAVPATETYVVEVTGLPAGWESCPGHPTRQPIMAVQFDRATGVAPIQVRACRGVRVARGTGMGGH